MALKKAKEPNESKKTGGRRGGKRDGSGRKPSEQTLLRRQEALLREDFEKLERQFLIEGLPDFLRNLKKVADGGFERTEDTFEPDKNTGKMMLARRVVSVAEPDRVTNQYLVDRLLGKPIQRKQIMADERGTVPEEFQRAGDVAYGEGTGEGTGEQGHRGE